jgi:hypothetical protein
MLVHLDAIKKVYNWLGSRLKLDIMPETRIDTVVSREKVAEFKYWFGRSHINTIMINSLMVQSIITTMTSMCM